MTPTRLLILILSVMPLCLADSSAADDTSGQDHSPSYEVWPIGWVRKQGGKTVIEVDEAYMPALLGLDQFDSIWVLYWFDRNDTPEQRRILQVHPRGNPDNPMRGVFATRAPVRPNLIALSRCRIISIQGNRIEIDEIDAFPNTPVLDIKP
ncbi:MAG: tRNA (N6-threonylcarbamoyladenosine(37)-N6)-methyltransferase TrmO [Candidatus Thiodiazotropha sp.]